MADKPPAQIQGEYRDIMNKLAANLDEVFNGHLVERETGFFLAVFPGIM